MNSIDIAKYLKSYRMIGQLYPDRKDIEGKPIIALLVPLSTAMAEFTEWSGQDVTKGEFVKALKDDGVLVFNSVDDYVKVRDDVKALEKQLKKDKKKQKRNISEERKNKLKEHAELMRSKIRPSISENA